MARSNRNSAIKVLRSFLEVSIATAPCGIPISSLGGFVSPFFASTVCGGFMWQSHLWVHNSVLTSIFLIEISHNGKHVIKHLKHWKEKKVQIGYYFCNCWVFFEKWWINKDITRWTEKKHYVDICNYIHIIYIYIQF